MEIFTRCLKKDKTSVKIIYKHRLTPTLVWTQGATVSSPRRRPGGVRENSLIVERK